MTTPDSAHRLVAGFARRLVEAVDGPMQVLAEAVAELAGGTAVAMQWEAGLLRPVGHATLATSDAGLLDAVLQAAAVPVGQAARLVGSDGDVPVDDLPEVLRDWCRHRRPVRSTVLPMSIAGRDIGILWFDHRTDVDLDDVRDLVAVTLSRHLALEEASASTDWAMQAETAMSARSEELETANQSIDQLGSIVGHELRDALRALLGWSRLASAPDLAESVRYEMLRKIVHSTEEAGGLVGDLLEAVEAQQQGRLAQVPVDLNGVVGWVRDVLAERIDHQRARVLADPLPTVLCNPTALRRTMLELVRNSLEHGGRFVEVHVQAIAHHDHVELIVQDNGPGVEADDHEDVFLPGFGTGVGAGFGLTNVRETLARVGGRVWIEDAPMGGAKVRITIPRPDAVTEDVRIEA